MHVLDDDFIKLGRLAGIGIGTFVTFHFGLLKSMMNNAQSAGLNSFSEQAR